MMDVMVPHVFLTKHSTHMPKLGVSVFDPTYEHDMNVTWVFASYGWVLAGLSYKRVDPKVTN